MYRIGIFVLSFFFLSLYLSINDPSFLYEAKHICMYLNIIFLSEEIAYSYILMFLSYNKRYVSEQCLLQRKYDTFF